MVPVGAAMAYWRRLYICLYGASCSRVTVIMVVLN